MPMTTVTVTLTVTATVTVRFKNSNSSYIPKLLLGLMAIHQASEHHQQLAILMQNNAKRFFKLQLLACININFV